MGHGLLEILGILALTYFAAINSIYLLFTVLAWQTVGRHLRRRRYAGEEEVFASPLTPAISVLLPAYNEEAGIVESVRSLVRLRYPRYEVVVVNDGSSDETLARLQAEFDLAPAHRALRDTLATAAVRATYVSRRHPELVVIDKDNGGKADALNCGIAAARHPYFCAVDADAMLEESALLNVARPVLDDPDLVVATGGIVRIANGCGIEHGRVTHVGLPASRLARLQVVEYFRAFLVGRVGWSRLKSLLIISGAFGLFQRSVVEAVGGYATDTVGEDAELVVRLHRYLRERGEDYRIEFMPDPVCWTEAPEDLRTLARQRRRWQRGLAETLWRHKTMIGRPSYGALGVLALPYFLIFELLGPLVELVSLLAIPLAYLLGALSAAFLAAFLFMAVLLGMLLSIAALALEEFSFRRHTSSADVARMLIAATLENLGYRQLVTVWRVMGLVDVLRGRSDWGTMPRRGLDRSAAAPARSTS